MIDPPPNPFGIKRVTTNQTFLVNTFERFNSTSNLDTIDKGSERSYTANSLNSTNLSIREARSRSFLVGSLSALNGKGLLSGDELERNLPDKRARVLVTTWNMNAVKKLSDNLDELLLPDMIQTMPDIYVIGKSP